MTQSAMHHWLSINCWTCELQSDKNSCRWPCSVGLDRTVGDAPPNVCLSRLAAWTDTPEKRTENNLIVRSGMSPNTILLIELSMYGTIFQTLLSRLLARYPFVVSWLNLIWVVFCVLIFNFCFFYIFSFVLSLSIVLAVFSMYFIGVSGLRVLLLLINWIELNLKPKQQY